MNDLPAFLLPYWSWIPYVDMVTRLCFHSLQTLNVSDVTQQEIVSYSTCKKKLAGSLFIAVTQIPRLTDSWSGHILSWLLRQEMQYWNVHSFLGLPFRSDIYHIYSHFTGKEIHLATVMVSFMCQIGYAKVFSCSIKQLFGEQKQNCIILENLCVQSCKKHRRQDVSQMHIGSTDVWLYNLEKDWSFSL